MSALQEQVQQGLAEAHNLVTLLERIADAVPVPPVVPEAPTRLIGLQNPAAFYDHIRGEAGELFPTITQAQIDGIEALLHYSAGVLPASWCAYCLATDYHETNRQMQAVREAYWTSEEWRKKHLRYYPWYGRGLVQLTWETNYKLASDKIGVDLIANPDGALVLDNAVKIMVEGMLAGWFTGKKLRDYITAEPTRDQFRNARRIINAMDKADLIAGYALEFYKALVEGEWK